MTSPDARRDSRASPGAPEPGEAPDARSLSGVIDRVTYHNEETGFAVLKVKAKGRKDLATVVGRIAAVAPGEKLEATGQWVVDRDRGPQFKAETISTAAPASASGIERYLASGLIRGIGQETAKKLVAAFGRDTLKVLDSEPERLAAVPGLTPERVRRIREGWTAQQGFRDVLLFLTEHGLGPTRAARVQKTFGPQAIELIREDPYRLAREIKGFDFQTADQFALSLGRGRDDPARLAAGLYAALQEGAMNGHCGVPRIALFERAARLLGVDDAELDQAAGRLLQSRTIIADTIGGEAAFFLPPLWKAENAVAERLKILAGGHPPWRQDGLSQAVLTAEARTGKRLAPAQALAVETALGSKCLVITGGPGVGKTTIIDTILKALDSREVEVALCAPTGRAAKRMAESTGREAKTIHRLLEIDPATGQFRRQRSYPIAADLVIADEASMIDAELMQALLDALPPHAALILVGDVDQLPSVGPGQVLGDIIASGAVSVVRLTEVFRQAGESRIIAAAHAVNEGTVPEGARSPEEGDFFVVEMASVENGVQKIIEIVTSRLPRRFGLDPVREVQVLTPMNRGPLGSQALTQALREVLNPAREGAIVRETGAFAPRDKVMQTDNDYEKEVFNGDIGYVTATDPRSGSLTVAFDGREVHYVADQLDSLVPAYATTIHKAQGSEYPAVVVVLANAHYPMLARNLLYTAITRGKRLAVLVTERRALRMAAEDAMGRRRWTRLREKLSA
ncbi:SF1B family DNA helicase RecD2 [Labrys wisconsinensis]|uniref:ATP-dependent RecD2 DNA helicase n=1 Tax=Labrys wisconsinensis TaxID=425677 RepID=A0ABU0IZB8_9HYPH|nr:ATP-dependent RecD-like DNA helicase [Labrys wisconsinensis]MDQ0467360.1 exodeoxyribonuclease V alpha subunit [Labrys wisconsinensis]